MTAAEIANLEKAGRSAMAYSPDTVEDRHFAGSLLTASILWSVGFIAIASTVLFAFS